MRVDLLSPADPRWDQILERCDHDVYHRPEWATVMERADGGDAVAALAGDGSNALLVPLVRRPLRDSSWDAVSPYGYGGPILTRGSSATFRDEAMAALVDHLQGCGAVSCFLRLHPLLNTDWPERWGTTVRHDPTVSVDLRETAEEHWAETRAGHRSDLKRARGLGVTARHDATFETLDLFVAAYRETMARVGATRYYAFDDRYFDDLRDGLGCDLQLWAAEQGGAFLGASLFCTCASSGLVQYHLSATVGDYTSLQPSKVIIDCVRSWGREHGYRRLHLGGGLGRPDDSLLRFKRGFSKTTHDFRTQRIVLDDAVYRRLAASAGQPDPDPRGFFPAYRADAVTTTDG